MALVLHGAHQDPRHAGKHPELKTKVITPDVLLQPHFASLEMLSTMAGNFPPSIRGTYLPPNTGRGTSPNGLGYKVIRVPIENGKATGEYEDFLTGFVTADGDVWGRPVGVAVARMDR